MSFRDKLEVAIASDARMLILILWDINVEPLYETQGHHFNICKIMSTHDMAFT